MNYQIVKKALMGCNLDVFTIQEFCRVTNIDPNTASVKLSRYKKAGYLESPKKGIYYFSDESINKYKIANKVYFPSYVSLDTILSQEGIIPEIVYTITSVTTKATREYVDSNTTYKYFKIKRQAYTGYFFDGNVYLATPEKALVDYLYFVSQGKRILNDRLYLKNINVKEVLSYSKSFNNKPLDNLVLKLFKKQ